MPKPSTHRPGFRSPLNLLFVGVLAASTSSIFIRLAQVEVPSLVIAAFRLSIASMVLLPITIARHRMQLQNLNLRQWGKILLAGLFLGIHFGTWISSLEYTSVTSSVVLVQTTPLFVMLLSPLLLSEKPGIWTVIGAVIAALGILLIASTEVCQPNFEPRCLSNILDTGGAAQRGNLLALCGALAAALYLIVGRTVRKKVALIPYVTLVYALAASSLILVVGVRGLPITGFSTGMFLWLVLLALIPQLLAHSIYNWALKHLPATTISLSLLSEPVSAALLAYLVLGETLPMSRLMGAGIVLLGIAIAILNPKPPLQGSDKIDTMQA